MAALQTLEMCALEKMEDFGPREVAGRLHIQAKKRHRPSIHDFGAQVDATAEVVARISTRRA